MMKSRSILQGASAALLLAALATSCVQDKPTQPEVELVTDPASYVNPFIGTGGHGHTYPGASMPFGMVQLSPDTRLEGWDGCSGYHYTDSIVYGFSHTHLSGTGVGDYNDVLLMPVVGYAGFDNGAGNGPDQGYASRFDKSSEKAGAGTYSVHLKDYGIDVDLTSTPRTGLHRYRFPASKESRIVIDLTHRDVVLAGQLKQVSPTEVEGYRVSRAWASAQHVYFVARFSKPTSNFKSKMVEILSDEEGVAPTEQPLIASLQFETEEGEEIMVQVGISAVSIEGARKNLEAEWADWKFEEATAAAHDTWNEALSKILVGGNDEEQKTVFYTALYHSLLNPNLFSDVDGGYRGMDGAVHNTGGGNQYTVFSLWDTFRATHPLFTITEQEKTNEFIQTFVRQYQDGGILPIWELAGNYTGCMIGYHAIPVITDAYRKGIRDYDVETIYEAMKHSANQDKLGLDYYKTQGFIPANGEGESVSKTLEYAYDDWCIGQIASDLGKMEDYKNFTERSLHYRNIFDPNTGFMRGKQHNGWWDPFDPYEVNVNFTEANSWQYSFFVPHDVAGLAELLGGRDQLENRLDSLFTAEASTTGRHQSDITGLVGQYAHGNEPSHHMAYLYNYTGSPWKTQRLVKQIVNDLYTDQPDGLCGNEDCGQMSSWYVLSSLGFYPVCPGNNEYAIGAAQFPVAEIRMENGKVLRITSSGSSSNADDYVESVALNGKNLERTYLTHDEVMNGGELNFSMGQEPNPAWGKNPEHYPNSAVSDVELVPVPYFDFEGLTFIDSMPLQMLSPNKAHEIYYTLDGTEPGPSSTKYSGAVMLRKNEQVRAVAISESGAKSFPIATDFLKVEGGRSIEVMSKYDSQYTGGGKDGLIDYLRGSLHFGLGAWQGYQGQDLKAVVSFDEPKTINEIRMGFLQDVKPWIWFPKEVEYAISMDGKTFETVATVPCDVATNDYKPQTKEFVGIVGGKTARYIRVIAKTNGPCPDWHLGAGGSSWLFADEIVIE